VDAPRVGLGADVARVERRAERLERRAVRVLEPLIGFREIARGVDDPALQKLLVLAALDEELAPLDGALGRDEQLVDVFTSAAPVSTMTATSPSIRRTDCSSSMPDMPGILRSVTMSGGRPVLNTSTPSRPSLASRQL